MVRVNPEVIEKQREVWQKRLGKKFGFSHALTDEDVKTLNKFMNKAVFPPLVVGALVSLYLFYKYISPSSFDDPVFYYVVLALGTIPGILVSAPFGMLIYAAFQKKWVGSYLEKIHERVARQERAKEEHLQRVEEDRLQKLTKLVRVSRRLKIAQVTKILGMDEDELYDKIVDWADKFGFVLDEDVLEFTGTEKEAFIEELEREFSEWEAAGPSGKI
ncbi:MAG: hypothetical protein ACTSU5_14640 [Promethearchaeota archaeon]